MLLANNIRLFSAALVGLLAVAGLAWLSRFNAPPVIPYVALLSLGSAVGFALLWRVEKISIWLVLGIAALLHEIGKSTRLNSSHDLASRMPSSA